MFPRVPLFRSSFIVLHALSAILAVALGGCGKPAETPRPSTAAPVQAAPAPPSADSAKELIANSAEWSEFQFTHAAYTLPLKRSAM
ncbi:MAG TPA: hypothetical protein VFL80_12765, partial [Thermoanaerobaculia bacterium]|nr:hypothetical protein [Thermoanaerobaculia bacterium]